MHKRNLKDESGSVTNLHVCVSGRGRALLWINRALLLLSAYCPLEPAAQIFKTPSRRLPYINLRTSPLTYSHFHRTFLTSRSWKTSPSAPLAVEPVPLSSLQTRTTEDSERDGPCRIRARILSYESEDTLENTRLLLQCTSVSPPLLIPPVPSLPRIPISHPLTSNGNSTAACETTAGHCQIQMPLEWSSPVFLPMRAAAHSAPSSAPRSKHSRLP